MSYIFRLGIRNIGKTILEEKSMNLKLKKGKSKTFWTLRFTKDNEIDIGECHGDGALHLWATKKNAENEAQNFDEEAIPTRIRIERLS